MNQSAQLYNLPLQNSNLLHPLKDKPLSTCMTNLFKQMAIHIINSVIRLFLTKASQILHHQFSWKMFYILSYIDILVIRLLQLFVYILSLPLDWSYQWTAGGRLWPPRPILLHHLQLKWPSGRGGTNRCPVFGGHHRWRHLLWRFVFCALRALLPYDCD